jgi:hypothetical protein
MAFYLEIIRNVFQALDDEGRLRNRIVAFTSATRGEGVSYVVNTIAKELAEQTHKRVLAVDAVGLQNIRVPGRARLFATVLRLSWTICWRYRKRR